MSKRRGKNSSQKTVNDTAVFSVLAVLKRNGQRIEQRAGDKEMDKIVEPGNRQN